MADIALFYLHASAGIRKHHENVPLPICSHGQVIKLYNDFDSCKRQDDKTLSFWGIKITLQEPTELRQGNAFVVRRSF